MRCRKNFGQLKKKFLSLSAINWLIIYLLRMKLQKLKYKIQLLLHLMSLRLSKFKFRAARV